MRLLLCLVVAQAEMPCPRIFLRAWRTCLIAQLVPRGHGRRSTMELAIFLASSSLRYMGGRAKPGPPSSVGRASDFHLWRCGSSGTDSTHQFSANHFDLVADTSSFMKALRVGYFFNCSDPSTYLAILHLHLDKLIAGDENSERKLHSCRPTHNVLRGTWIRRESFGRRP